MIQLFQIINPVIPSNIGAGGNTTGPLAFGKIIGSLVAMMYIVGFFTALIFLITGGFYWITSAGDKSKLESARDRILHSIIGLIVIFSSYAIMTLIATFIGWEEFPKIPLPTISQSGAASNNNSSGRNAFGCYYEVNSQGYACYSMSECVQCVNGTTVSRPRSACVGLPCFE